MAAAASSSSVPRTDDAGSFSAGSFKVPHMDDAASFKKVLAEERFVAGSGPGGQNANKVATEVQLRQRLQAAALPVCVPAAGRGCGQSPDR